LHSIVAAPQQIPQNQKKKKQKKQPTSAPETRNAKTCTLCFIRASSSLRAILTEKQGRGLTQFLKINIMFQNRLLDPLEDHTGENLDLSWLIPLLEDALSQHVEFLSCNSITGIIL
jgi:hypothetical protein